MSYYDEYTASNPPRPTVFVSGPLFSSGQPFYNVGNALEAGMMLMDLGCTPIVPHVAALWEQNPAWRRGEESHWVPYCMDLIIECSNAVFRLPGESKWGAKECEIARDINIPVLETKEEVKEFLYRWCKQGKFDYSRIKRAR